MRRGLVPTALLAVVIVVLLVVGVVGYYEVTETSTSPTTGFVTGTGVTTATDTFLTQCSVTGIGGIELRVVSDSTGAPVTGEEVNAVDTLGCAIASGNHATVTQSPSSSAVPPGTQYQVVYIDNFSVGQGGWLTPVFPAQAEPGGELNFTVSYQGATYRFTAAVPPIGTSCVTLHVPSGNVTTSAVMNGSGSYCNSSQPNSAPSTSIGGHDSISVSGLSLCSTNCGYPAPYASALIAINGSVPISSLMLYVNNTYDGTVFQNPSTTTVGCTTGSGQTCSAELGGTAYSSGNSTTVTKIYATCSVPEGGTSCSATYTGSVNTLTVFDYQYKGSVPSAFIPVIPGDTYVFKFVATFQDGSTATAIAPAVAN